MQYIFKSKIQWLLESALTTFLYYKNINIQLYIHVYGSSVCPGGNVLITKRKKT